MTALEACLEAIPPLDDAAMRAAQARLDRLTKPPGSLGRMEELVVWLAGVTGRPDASIRRRAVIVAAADHGVAASHPVSAYPPEVTAQMVRNFLSRGAAISVLARLAEARVVVLDVGVASAVQAGGDGTVDLVSRPVRPGTADMTVGPAMTRDEADQAIGVGVSAALEAIRAGADLIAIGDMGIGNTTAASAIVASLLGRSVPEVTGRGTGVDSAGLARKIEAIERAIEVNQPDPADPIGVLSCVGGLEIAALVGVIVAAAAAHVPVVLDGFITGAAALVACAWNPNIASRLVASHRSPEPGHRLVLERLGLRPLLDLDMRLGEGSGAALAIPLLDAAVRVRDEMATFESAGVAGPVG